MKGVLHRRQNLGDIQIIKIIYFIMIIIIIIIFINFNESLLYTGCVKKINVVAFPSWSLHNENFWTLLQIYILIYSTYDLNIQRFRNIFHGV